MSGAEQTDASAQAPEPESDACLAAIEAGARGLLAERGGSVLAATLPADLPLVLHANVRVIPLAEVLGLVHALGTSGFLFFSQGDHAKSVYLHRGEVVFATSNQRVDRLGECLLRAGVITIEQLREAERRFSPPDRFGKALVERGFLTPRELWHGVKYQVEEIVRSLFSYTGGMVGLWEGDVQPDNVVRLSLPTRRLVAEGIQRRDELMKFLALLEDPRVVLTPVPGREVSLAANERALYEALSREGSFAALRRRIGLDALSAARVVQLLRLVGAVRLVRTRDDGTYLGESDLRVHDDASVREHVADHVKLLAELAAPIVAAEGDEGLRERLGRIVEGLAQRHPELLTAIQLGPGATLDPEIVTERALALPGERREQVAAVLGELRDYLEFELKNHPEVREADRVLDGLKDLRARLEG